MNFEDFLNTVFNSQAPDVNEFTSDAWHAYRENPDVFCAVGMTPALALHAMADILVTHDIEYWTASSVSFDDDGCYITIYV